MRILTALLAAAASGMLAMGVCGAVDVALRASLILLSPDRVILPWFWIQAVWLMAGYLMAGGLLGLLLPVATGLAARSEIDPTAAVRTGATGLVALAFVVNVCLERPRPGAVYASLLFAAAVISAVIVRLRATSWSRRLGVLTNPWAASFIILVPVWLDGEVFQKQHRGLWMALMAALALAVASSAFRRSRPAASGGFSLPRDAVVLGGFLGAVFGIAAWLNQGHLPWPELRAQKPAGDRPNVVVLVLDTARADHMPMYGYGRDTTPELKRFASQATLYKHAISASNMTLSSHASIFTGLYASRHGAYYAGAAFPVGRPLDSEAETVAETLAKAGYRTVAAGANYAFLGPAFGLQQGFHLFDGRRPLQAVNNHSPAFPESRFFPMRLLIGPLSGDQMDRLFGRAEDVNAAARRMLERSQEERRPFLMVLNYMDVHLPLIPPPALRGRFPGYRPGMRPVKSFYYLTSKWHGPSGEVSDRVKQHWISQYDASLVHLDAQIASLFDHLRRLELYDNTVIMVTSDHGESVGDHDAMLHGASLYEEVVHVPLIV